MSKRKKERRREREKAARNTMMAFLVRFGKRESPRNSTSR